MKIPFVSFEYMNKQVKPQIMDSFERFFDKAWYILGDQVNQFETAYAEFNQIQHCIGVSNGLDALHLALISLEIEKGDEVIIPSNTYIATALAVSYTGACPVPVEPRAKTYNIDPDRIEAAITPNTKAIMPVHLYGQACEMEAIKTIADKHGLYIIEDNAQAQGASYNGRLTGSWGHVNGTSFYPGKNLGAFGDAGGITTNDTDLAQKVRVFRNYGSQKKYYNEVIGYNMRLDECQAAFLLVKLKYLQEWTEKRRQIASAYNAALRGVGDIILPEIADGASHVFHLYVIRTKFRDQLQQYLTNEGIGTLIHYPIPLHLQDAYQHAGYQKGSFPIAEEIADTCLSLPMWPGLNEEQIKEIAFIIIRFFDGI